MQRSLEWTWQYDCDLNITWLAGPWEGQGRERDFVKSRFLAMLVSSVFSSSCSCSVFFITKSHPGLSFISHSQLPSPADFTL